MLIRTEWHMALLLFSFMPFIFAITIGFRNLARRVTRRGMQAMADVNAAIKETVSGISIAKNFRQEASIFTIFDAANQQSYRVNVQRGFVLSLVFPVLNAMGGIFTAILVYAGGLSITQGLVTVGAWYLFILSLDAVLLPHPQSLRLLGADPAGPGSRRTRLCPDRCRPQRGADGNARRAASAR